jgi:hypothetical protein
MRGNAINWSWLSPWQRVLADAAAVLRLAPDSSCWWSVTYMAYLGLLPLYVHGRVRNIYLTILLDSACTYCGAGLRMHIGLCVAAAACVLATRCAYHHYYYGAVRQDIDNAACVASQAVCPCPAVDLCYAY